MSAHAIDSPSGAAGWMRCPSWLGGTGDSVHSLEGTAAHELAAKALTTGAKCEKFIGMESLDAPGVIFTDDMAADTQIYVDHIRSLPGTLMVEQRLSIEHITNELGAKGTSDAVLINGSELIIGDLKFGRGVKVDAEENEQLQIYALAALHEFSMVEEFETVRMMIFQPRLGHVSEWVQTTSELFEFDLKVRQAIANRFAQRNGMLGDAQAYAPGAKQCRWCSKKATCPALRTEVIGQVFGASPLSADEFEDLTVPDAKHIGPTGGDWLSAAMDKVDLIEVWCREVRAEVERRLLDGIHVPRWKLVEGKRGNRKWADDKAAEKMLRETFRLKVEDTYDMKLISPTSAEKLLKAGVIGPRQWPKLQPLITQSEGSPSVAPESDRRPALSVAADDEFEAVTQESVATDLV